MISYRCSFDVIFSQNRGAPVSVEGTIKTSWLKDLFIWIVAFQRYKCKVCYRDFNKDVFIKRNDRNGALSKHLQSVHNIDQHNVDQILWDEQILNMNETEPIVSVLRDVMNRALTYSFVTGNISKKFVENQWFRCFLYLGIPSYKVPTRVTRTFGRSLEESPHLFQDRDWAFKWSSKLPVPLPTSIWLSLNTLMEYACGLARQKTFC